MNTLKHTAKQLTLLIKQFHLYKSTFLKSTKLLPSKQPLLALAFSKIDSLSLGVQRISKLTVQAEEAGSVLMSKSAMIASSAGKKTEMIVQHDVAVRKANGIVVEVVGVMGMVMEFRQIEHMLQQQSQSLLTLTFCKQPLLLMLKVTFHLLTFLANIQKLLQPQQQLIINNIAVEAIRRCLQAKSTFLLICSAIVQSEEQQLGQQQLGKTIGEVECVRQEYKSLLLRVSAVFYQLLYNFEESESGNCAQFFCFICSLITDKIETQKHTSPQYSTPQRKSEQKKGFFSMFKKQSTNKNLVNKSQTIQALKKKPKYMDPLQISSNNDGSASQKLRQSGKSNLKKQPKSAKINMKPYTPQSSSLSKQFFLSRDEVQIVQFYLCSLLQKTFMHESSANIPSLIKEYMPLMGVVLEAYVSSEAQEVEEENDKSLHDRLEEVLLKIIYKDHKLKHEDLLGEQSAYQLTISYQQLLNRVIATLSCTHTFLHQHFPTLTLQPTKPPPQTLPNSNLLLDFIITLYQKIMMAHKCFIQTQISQSATDSKHIPPSPSQNINSHRNLNKQTEKKFNLLYVMNTVVVNIIGMLYRCPLVLVTEEQKVSELNTLLTLHQIFLNQFNFPNYEIENQVIESFRDRKEGKERELQIEKLNNNENKKLQSPIDICAEYITNLDSLKKHLIKTHQATYNQLKRLHAIHQSSSIHRSSSKQPSTTTTTTTNQLTKSANLSPTIRILSPQQQKTPFQQYQQLIFSYQNITLESLQQTANQLQETFLNYYKKNKVHLYKQPQRMFEYFKKVSTHFFNYLSWLMMILYKNNCKVEGREGFGIKNNVMTSLKLIKVLEKVITFFWQLYWKFQDQLLLVDTKKKPNSQSHQPPTIATTQNQPTPMLTLIQQLNIDFFKLLQKFCFPRASEKFDFRHMRSCLIVSSLIDIYKQRLEGFALEEGRFVEMRVRQSKPLIKVLLQIVQRASVSTVSEQFQATNVQTKARLTQNVIQKSITIFTNPIITTHLSTTMPQLIYNQHFNLLVQIMFQNYSQLKQKIDEENFTFIGEESMVIGIVKGIVRSASGRVFVGGEGGQSGGVMGLRMDENELEKLTVILQMYLAKQQYMIESKKLNNNACLVEQISQIPLLSMELFQQIVDFVINVQLILPNSYTKVSKIIYQSRHFDLGFMSKMKENIINLSRFANKHLSQQSFTHAYHLQPYTTLFIQLYHKLMTTYMISFTSERGNKISPTYLLEMGLEIFQCILELNKLVGCMSREELVMLWRMKRGLTAKVRMVERGVKDVRLELLLVGNVLCVRDDSVVGENNNSNNRTQIMIQLISQTLQNLYQRLSISAQKYRKNPRKTTKLLTQLLQPFTTKSSPFFKDLFLIMGTIIGDDQQQTQNILFPSEFMQLINELFYDFSEWLRQYKKSTLDSLIGMDTPTFKMDEEKKKSKEVIIMKKTTKDVSSGSGIKLNQSIKSLQMEQNEEEEVSCELQRNMARSIHQSSMQQSAALQFTKSIKKNVIVSSLQFQDPQQSPNSHNQQEQQQQSQQRDEIVQQQQQQQHNDNMRQSQPGSMVVLQLPSSENSFQDAQRLNDEKLVLIRLFNEFYNNLFGQLEELLSVEGWRLQSQQKDFEQVVQDLCAMVDRLKGGAVYRKQLLQASENNQVKVQDQQCVEMMKQCHLVVASRLRMLIIKYQQQRQHQSPTQNNKLSKLLITLEQSLIQIAMNCCQLASIQNAIQEKKFKQKIIRLYGLQKQQLVKARTTIKKLTLNPRQSRGYFGSDDGEDIVENSDVEGQVYNNDKKQANNQHTIQQQTDTVQSEQINEITPLSQPFHEYIQFLEQLIQQMQRLSAQQIKQLFELKQSHLRQFLLAEYDNIRAMPCHQQTGYIQLVGRLFGLIKTLLTQRVWSVAEVLGQQSCKGSNKMALYDAIYQTIYPCLVQYIDLSKFIGSIVKDILKHNLTVANELDRNK